MAQFVRRPRRNVLYLVCSSLIFVPFHFKMSGQTIRELKHFFPPPLQLASCILQRWPLKKKSYNFVTAGCYVLTWRAWFKSSTRRRRRRRESKMIGETKKKEIREIRTTWGRGNRKANAVVARHLWNKTQGFTLCCIDHHIYLPTSSQPIVYLRLFDVKFVHKFQIGIPLSVILLTDSRAVTDIDSKSVIYRI